jgi:hypothetical protein
VSKRFIVRLSIELEDGHTVKDAELWGSAMLDVYRRSFERLCKERHPLDPRFVGVYESRSRHEKP